MKVESLYARTLNRNPNFKLFYLLSRDTTWADLIDNETVNVLAKPGGAPIDALVFPSYYILDGAQKDLVAPADTRILAHAWRSKTPYPPGKLD